MGSFFSLLQKNVLNRRAWYSREELRIAIATWIERTYHRRRRQDGLGPLTPIEYETIMTPPVRTGPQFSDDRASSGQHAPCVWQMAHCALMPRAQAELSRSERSPVGISRGILEPWGRSPLREEPPRPETRRGRPSSEEADPSRT